MESPWLGPHEVDRPCLRARRGGGVSLRVASSARTVHRQPARRAVAPRGAGRCRRSFAAPRPLRRSYGSCWTAGSPMPSTSARRVASSATTQSCTGGRPASLGHAEPGVCRAGGGPRGPRHRHPPELDGRSWLASPAGTDETSPLARRQPLPYNRWKARGEQVLRRTCLETGTRFVTLRPGIVYGPRSQWIAGFAQSVVDGTAYVVAGGRGVCNAITSTTSCTQWISRSTGRRPWARRSSSPTTGDHLAHALRAGVPRIKPSLDAVADLAPRAPRRTSRERLLELKENAAARRALDRAPQALLNPLRP